MAVCPAKLGEDETGEGGEEGRGGEGRGAERWWFGGSLIEGKKEKIVSLAILKAASLVFSIPLFSRSITVFGINHGLAPGGNSVSWFHAS